MWWHFFLAEMAHQATHPFNLLGKIFEISHTAAHHSPPTPNSLLGSMGCHRALGIPALPWVYRPVVETFAKHLLPSFITSKTCLFFNIPEFGTHLQIDDMSYYNCQFLKSFLVVHKIMVYLTIDRVLDLMKYGMS